MIEYFYEIVIFLNIVYFSIKTAISDLKYGKIYNKDIKIGVISACIIQMLYICFGINNGGSGQKVIIYILNLLIGSMVSYLLFKFNLWGAGDSKYLILLLLLAPINTFSKNRILAEFTVRLLVITFSLAFIFIIIQSIYFKIKEVPTLNNANRRINRDIIKEIFIQWLIFYFLLTIISFITRSISDEFWNNNIILIRLIISMFMFYYIDKMKNKNVIYTLVIVGIIIKVYEIISIHNISLSIQVVDLIFYLFVVFILFSRKTCAMYNYKKIKTQSVREGMIISTITSMSFINSKVKGLPSLSDETINSKINKDEADSIRRWENSKYGSEYIFIVREIPFAPFISLGMILSCIFLL